METLKKYRTWIVLAFYLFIVYFNKEFLNLLHIEGKAKHYGFYLTHIVMFFLGIVFLYGDDYKKDFKKFSKKLFPNIGLSVIAYFATLVLLFIVNLFIKDVSSNVAESVEALTQTGFLQFLGVVIASIIGPMNEELVFRKILIGDMKRYCSSKAIRLVISSVLFALIHIFSWSELVAAIPYLVPGFVLGGLYLLKEENIAFSCLTHIFNNSVGSILKMILKA
ncbi:CPBP family intramembrane glutamic endopeptidase [Streptococcus catagoni]|uniref:CPBP family intramembrane glutamic endopeptidase n=1 Tax=Streptococcus catagoni TaxID=2654874 RepID=UPI00140CF52A|nr:CPBP family intramembrane glutamic endopeptidase [Streptococcus catagoni]